MKTNASVNYCSSYAESWSTGPQYVGKIDLEEYFYLKSKGVANELEYKERNKSNISQH